MKEIDPRRPESIEKEERWNRLLVALVRRSGGRVEIPPHELDHCAPGIRVVQDPQPNQRGNTVFRLLDERSCPCCD